MSRQGQRTITIAGRTTRYDYTQGAVVNGEIEFIELYVLPGRRVRVLRGAALQEYFAHEQARHGETASLVDW